MSNSPRSNGSSRLGQADRREEALDSMQGWLLAVLGLCILTMTWGTIFTFTVYADQLAATFGLSAFQVSSVFSITTAFLLLVGGIFGLFAARFPLRPVVTAVGLGIGLATALLQVVGSYVGVTAAFALFGTAGGTAFIVVVSLVPQWFDTYQGLATSITVTGLGLGPLVFPFVWLWLFDRTDFRTAFVIVGGLAAVVVLASSLAFRRPPGRPQKVTTVDVTWIRAMIGDPRFLTTMIGFALIWNWYYVLSSQLVDILTAGGIDVKTASAALGIIGGVSIFTRIGGGFLGDRIGQRKTFAMSIILAGVCILVLPFIRSRFLLYVDVVGLGVAFGPLASLWSPIVLTRFGPENATAIIGLLTVGLAGAAFLAPLAVSALHGVTGGYVVPLAALSVVTVLGAVLFHRGTGKRK